ncbi:MAG: hypothetical protein IT536_15785 [Hyphomicrobiales bacterium]|nr:hypothetical protein [Hyphomicrobiales bacterium]
MSAKLPILSALLIVVMSFGPADAEIIKREPAMGKLKLGQRVLVDDGRCPKGQIMEVIGGDHVRAGGTQQIERRRRCIPRP